MAPLNGWATFLILFYQVPYIEIVEDPEPTSRPVSKEGNTLAGVKHRFVQAGNLNYEKQSSTVSLYATTDSNNQSAKNWNNTTAAQVIM